MYELPDPHPEMIKNIRNVLEKYGFEAALIRQAAYIDSYTFRRISDDYGYEGLNLPEKTKAEEKYKDFVDKLSRAMKKTVTSETKLMNHGRLLKPVGFSGKDKIICIIEIFRINNKETIRVRYGTPPPQLISDWEKHEGNWVMEND